MDQSIYALVRELSGFMDWKEYAFLVEREYSEADIEKLVSAMAQSKQEAWRGAEKQKNNKLLFERLNGLINDLRKKNHLTRDEKNLLTDVTVALERVSFCRKEKKFIKIRKGYVIISEWSDVPESVQKCSKRRWILLLSKEINIQKEEITKEENNKDTLDKDEHNKKEIKGTETQSSKPDANSDNNEKLEKHLKNLRKLKFLLKSKADFIGASLDKGQVEIFVDDFPEPPPTKEAWKHF